jgi:threonine dehydratase
MVRLDLDRIRRARTAIDPVFLDTPQYECAALGDVLGCSITLKIETLNPVRSFKGRGTETALSWLAQREEAPTAVCASAGNLGQALAYSGARRGIPVTVVAARTANPFKIERITALGARVRLAGDDIEDARLLARTIAEDEGAHLVEGQPGPQHLRGSRDDRPRTAGRSIAARHACDRTRRRRAGKRRRSCREIARPTRRGVAVQPMGAPAMALSWRRGSVVETDTIETIADGVAGRCPIPEVLDDLLIVVDDVALVGEESIKAGMRLLYRYAGLVVEPSAALGVAALLENRKRFTGRRVATIICGSNVTTRDYERWVLSPG